MSTESGSITIKDVRHIMNLLVGNLYGEDPHLTIRELVQNAHDGIVDLPPEVPDRSKLISIRVNAMASKPYLEVRDTGIGMSKEEMKENFGKIGDSEKLSRALQNPDLIGRFGIGFLSSFIIADRVQVITRKYGTEQTWLWETTNQQDWSLSEHSEKELKHGTWIRLYFRDHYEGMNAERVSDVKTVDGVEEIIRTYCYLIPFPIQVGLADQPGRRVNAARPPWENDTEALEAFKVLFGKSEPFFFHRVDVADPRTGNRARGVLYFRPQLTRVPSVQLYVKRMLVDPEDRFLVPPYGVFVSGLAARGKTPRFRPREASAWPAARRLNLAPSPGIS